MADDAAAPASGSCPSPAIYHEPPSVHFIRFTWTLFAVYCFIWLSTLPILWHFRKHGRFRRVRIFCLNVFTVFSTLLWALLSLNLVLPGFPCLLLPLCILGGIAGCAVHFCLRLIMFAIESQFAKNAHLFKTGSTYGRASVDSDSYNISLLNAASPSTATGTAASPQSPPYGAAAYTAAPYWPSMWALVKLLFGFSALDTLEFAHLARARRCYTSLVCISMLPGLIGLAVIWGAFWPRYFYCTGCSVIWYELVAFFMVAAVYIVLTGRILYVLHQANFPDEFGVLRELKLTWVFAGLPLLPITVVWSVDVADGVPSGQFAFEWLFQLDLLVFWWFAVGAQMLAIHRRRMQRRRSRSSLGTSTAAAAAAPTTISLFRTGRRSNNNSPQQQQQQQPPQSPRESQFAGGEELHDVAFSEFMVRQFAVESLCFLQDVNTYKLHFATQKLVWRNKKAAAMMDMYIRPGSAMEINISDSARRRILNQMDSTTTLRSSNLASQATVTLFDEAAMDVRRSIVIPLWSEFDNARRMNRRARRHSSFGLSSFTAAANNSNNSSPVRRNNNSSLNYSPSKKSSLSELTSMFQAVNISHNTAAAAAATSMPENASSPAVAHDGDGSPPPPPSSSLILV